MRAFLYFLCKVRKLLGTILLLTFAALSWAENQAADWTWQNGELPGRFQVNAAGDVVLFAQGNLVYNSTSDEWSFASHQFDVIGEANLVSGSTELANRIDLFGWSGDGNMASNFGVTNTASTSAYAGEFVNWGDNPITTDGNKAYAWRTLSSDEWTYILTNHEQYATTINGVKGIALIPKQTTLTKEEKKDTYTASEWQPIEAKGVVFLPLTGFRAANSTSVSQVNDVAYYWTSTKSGTTSAMIMRCTTTAADEPTSCTRKQGNPVRLVKASSFCTVNVKAVPNIAGAGDITITVIE